VVHIFPKGEGKVYDYLSLYLYPVNLTNVVYTYSFTITGTGLRNSKNRFEK
ncbi:hypothetical protein MKW98_020262, partial [Papaver atlanticum]